MRLLAEFREEGPARTAVSALRDAGFGAGDIEVFSSRPIEFARGVIDRPSRMSLIAVLAAILNGGLATAFVYYTQRDYEVVTGGMPLTSGWATGVITYELTMAGAVAGIVLAFLWESRLLRRRTPRPPVHDGAICIRVESSDALATAAETCLREAGATEVIRQS